MKLGSNKKHTVLVVDDEPSILQLVRRLIERQGYEVDCAESPQEALVMLARQDYSLVLTDIIAPYGDYDIAIDGSEAVQAFRLAWEDKNPYDLICMDIMMPNVDGQEALVQIREFEKSVAVKPHCETKVIMISALDAPKPVVSAFYRGGATSYIVKPIVQEDLLQEMMNLGLIS